MMIVCSWHICCIESAIYLLYLKFGNISIKFEQFKDIQLSIKCSNNWWGCFFARVLEAVHMFVYVFIHKLRYHYHLNLNIIKCPLYICHYIPTGFSWEYFVSIFSSKRSFIYCETLELNCGMTMSVKIKIKFSTS